jgi:DNA-binding Lrp family transcriptional regulator
LEVTECCTLAGAHDYVLRVLTRDLTSFERFLKDKLANVKMIEDIQSTIILNQVINKAPPLT